MNKAIIRIACLGWGSPIRSQLVPTYWVLLDVPDITAAIAGLARREGISKGAATDIGFLDAKTAIGLGFERGHGHPVGVTARS